MGNNEPFVQTEPEQILKHTQHPIPSGNDILDLRFI